ncbi:hypothetical protein BDB01DRAFT_814736 [Pilobolus umbonatus]|nr:hypothetical protein BDB01DRAFT_814736 [Pilobolus umbonatus]
MFNTSQEYIPMYMNSTLTMRNNIGPLYSPSHYLPNNNYNHMTMSLPTAIPREAYGGEHPPFGNSFESNASSFGHSPNYPRTELLMTPSSSTGQLGDTYLEDEDMNQKSHQEMYDKKRKRRECHNAVERRRRDNINEKILELSLLLPDHLRDSVPASSNVMSVAHGQNNNGMRMINKGTILKLSVDHIKELTSEVTHCKSKIEDLEYRIKQAQRDAKGARKHERMGSSQFQQQFNQLHITQDEQH